MPDETRFPRKSTDQYVRDARAARQEELQKAKAKMDGKKTDNQAKQTQRSTR